MKLARFVVLAFTMAGCATTTSASGPAPSVSEHALPECIREIGGGSNPRATPRLSAPTIEPLSGSAGTPVTVTAHGYPADTEVVVIAFYGENGCDIGKGGFGDHLLARVRTDQAGDLAVTMSWPELFVPYGGRDAIGDVALPAGPYYLMIEPCAQPGELYCSLRAISEAGGPFTQT